MTRYGSLNISLDEDTRFEKLKTKITQHLKTHSYFHEDISKYRILIDFSKLLKIYHHPLHVGHRLDPELNYIQTLYIGPMDQMPPDMTSHL